MDQTPITNGTGSELKYATIWCITCTRDSTHALVPTTHSEMFFQTEEQVKKYMDKVPDDGGARNPAITS